MCVFSDLCTAFGKDVMKLVEVRPLINDLLTEGRRSKTTKTKTLATWATKELRKLKSQAWCVTRAHTHTQRTHTPHTEHTHTRSAHTMVLSPDTFRQFVCLLVYEDKSCTTLTE